MKHTTYDVIIVGSGVSGSFFSKPLCDAGLRCLMLEAGHLFSAETFPREEVDANAQLFWSGGIEFNRDVSIGLLRPKAVGGGSIVNQALVDRFDAAAFEEWKSIAGVSFFDLGEMQPWYELAEKELCIQSIPEKYWNSNARIFQKGCELHGYRYATLRRAQNDCRFEEGNDCILCLFGCPRDSKQSTLITVLKKALERGLELVSDFEVHFIGMKNGTVLVKGTGKDGREGSFTAERLVLAAGAIGNTKLLLSSGFGERLPALGRGFYTHPQTMSFGLYDEPIRAHKGPFQALKSDDPNFRENGFKLENVFAPPGATAMLLPGFGESHQRLMEKMDHFACIEVAVRDTEPGTIRMRGSHIVIEKKLNAEDKRRRDQGLAVVDHIFRSTGAKRIIRGGLPIGLHLMGGCAMGIHPETSVVDSQFRMHGEKNIYIADSSIFPSAPGINPSLTIMALSLRGANQMLKGRRA